MRFSIIIAVHNAADTLELSLNTIQSQSFTDFELIIVDDASTDGSHLIAEAHLLSSHIIRLSGCIGPGAARNRGAAAATGEYLAFLDADDAWFPWSLEAMDAAIRSTQEPCFISGNAVRGVALKKFQDVRLSPLHFTCFQDYFETAGHHLWIGVGGVAIKRSEYFKVAGFAEWLANSEDSDLWLRLGKSPGFVHLESPPIFFYRQTEHSRTRQLSRIAPGYLNLVHNEYSDAYPGGSSSRTRRWQILTRHTRSGSLHLLDLGQFRNAFLLYRSTFVWNLSLLRIRYLLGFWGLALVRLLR